jgi:CheY-like chemotaxis protein
MMAPEQHTVLVVDDDPDLRTMVTLVLESGGYAVREAADGVEAIERLQEELPDLILLDMRMPRMDGWELGRRVRAMYRHEIPIVVMTAAEHAEKRASEIDADDFVSKPFDVDTVLRTVAHHIRPHA